MLRSTSRVCYCLLIIIILILVLEYPKCPADKPNHDKRTGSSAYSYYPKHYVEKFIYRHGSQIFQFVAPSYRKPFHIPDETT